MLARRLSALAVVLLITVAGAAAKAQTATAAPPLRVGTSGDYRPFSFRDAGGAFTGFDIAVAERLAADLGHGLELVSFRWPELMAGLEAGRFDVAMSGVTVRADRAVRARFSRPYAITGAVAVVRASDRSKLRRLADLDRADMHLAVNAGGHLEQVARHQFTHAQLVTVADNAVLPDLLRRRAADAVISEGLEARTWPAQEFVLIGPFTHDRKAYVASRTTADLVPRIDAWLAAREADGWLNQQRRRWLGERAIIAPERISLEALVAAIGLRLQLMPLVGAVKRREHLPIEDPAQEARVLDRVRTAAAAAGLDRDDVASVFTLQIAVAKSIEQNAAAEPVPADVSLADLRAALASVSDQVIAELARCQPWLRNPHTRGALDRTARNGLASVGLTARQITQLVQVLGRVR